MKSKSKSFEQVDLILQERYEQTMKDAPIEFWVGVGARSIKTFKDDVKFPNARKALEILNSKLYKALK